MTRKVHFISSHAQLGGSERYLADLIRGMARTWEIEVTCLQDGPFVERLRELRIDVTILPIATGPASILSGALRLGAHLRRSGADVVHANGVKAAVVTGLGFGGAPIVWAKHDFSWDSRSRWIARRCACVVGVSSAVLAAVRGVTRTVVVHPGIEEAHRSDIRSDALKQLVAGAGPVVILVGRLHPVKGYRNAIELAPALVRRVPDLRILFVGGDDPALPDHGRELRELGQRRAGDAIVWAGQRDDVLELVAGSDALLITSGSDAEAARGEGFGYTALEAMAVGTPVVGYACGGLPEVVGSCGRLVARPDETGLIDAVAEVIADRSLSESLAACGRERVAELFSVERFVEQMQRVYLSVAA